MQGAMSELTQFSSLNLEQGSTKDLQPVLWLLELGITQFSDGYIQSLAAKNEDIEILWHSRSATPGPSLVLQILFSNLVNTLLSIRLLALTGFDGQALILLRWFVELSDVLVAMEHLLSQRHSWHPDPTKSSFSMPQQQSFSMFFLRLKVFRNLTIEHYEEMQRTPAWEMS